MSDETQVRIASKLYDARAAVRTLLGDEYEAKMMPGIEALKTLCDEKGLSPLVVATRSADGYAREGRGSAALLILAAAVELCERQE